MGTGSGGRETVLCGEGEGAAPSRVACSGWRARLEQRLQCAKLAVPRRQLQGRAPLHARLGAHRRARVEEQPHLIRVMSEG